MDAPPVPSRVFAEDELASCLCFRLHQLNAQSIILLDEGWELKSQLYPYDFIHFQIAEQIQLILEQHGGW